MKLHSPQASAEKKEDVNTNRIYLFPFKFPDELHASQASRYHHDSGNYSARVSFQQLYDSAPSRLTYWIPKNIDRFAAKLPGEYTKNIEMLLRETTLYPLFETFCDAHLTFSNDESHIAGQIVSMPKRVVGESGETHLCVDCMRSDREEHEQPYIHRSHQIPGVQVCWRHESRLLSTCPCCGCPFEQKNDFIITPWKCCEGCGLDLTSAAFYKPKPYVTKSELSFAIFAREMLLSPTTHLEAATLASIYKSKLIELGFSRGSYISRRAVTEALEDHYGKNILTSIDSAYRHNKNQQWFRLSGESAIFDVPLPRHLVLSQFLFGSASQFWHFASQITAQKKTSPKTITPERITKVQDIKPITFEHPTSEHTQTKFASDKKKSHIRIENILRLHPDWSIDDLWKFYPGLMKQLLHHNDDGFVWLNTLLDNKNDVAINDCILSGGSTNPDDIAWSQKIQNAAIALYTSIDMPKKISRNYLMIEAGWNQTNMPDSAKFPLARHQLELHSESSWHFYARRILWTKLRVGAVGASERSVLGASGIEHHQGLLVLEYFSTVSPTRNLCQGTIMEILDEFHIPKNWTGPAVGQTFQRPGRNSSRGGQASCTST